MSGVYRKLPLLIAIVSVAIGVNGLSAGKASAQRTVVCESIEMQRETCPIDTRGGVELEEQLSETSCRNRWGYGDGRVWVDDGCRGSFRSLSSRYDRYDNNDRNNNDRYDRNNNDRYDNNDNNDNNDRNNNSNSNSREYYDDLNEIYQEVLGRDLDRQGFRAYSERMDNGWSIKRVREEVARSQEAKDAINRIYRRILRRNADAEGLQTYQNRLINGWSLDEVEQDLARSDEARQNNRRP